MPSVDRRWIPPVLIMAAAMASLTASGSLPDPVVARFGPLLPFDPAAPVEPLSRGVVLWLLPALGLILWTAFRLAPTAAGGRVGRAMFRRAPDEVTSPEQFGRFGGTYETIVLGVVALVLGLHAAMLAAALQAPGIAARIVPPRRHGRRRPGRLR